MTRYWLAAATAVLGALACIDSAFAQSAADKGTPIVFDQPVTGTINDGTRQFAYRLTAKAGDVVRAEIVTTSEALTSQQPGNGAQRLDSHVTILDSQNRELASSLPDHDRRTFLAGNSLVFAAIPADASYTVIAERSPSSRLIGDFRLTLTKLPVLAVGDTLKDKRFGAGYVIRSETDVMLSYRQASASATTLGISTIAGKDSKNLASHSGRLQVLGSVTMDGAALTSASLHLIGRKEPYVLTQTPDGAPGYELTVTAPR